MIKHNIMHNIILWMIKYNGIIYFVFFLLHEPLFITILFKCAINLKY